MLVPLCRRFRGRLRSGLVVCLKCGFRARGDVSALASCGQIWILFGFFFFPFPESRLFQLYRPDNPPKRPLAAFLSSEPRGYSVPCRRRERSREGQGDAVISPRSKYLGGRNGGKRGGVGVSYGRQSPPGEAPLLPSASPAAGRVDPELGAPRSPPGAPRSPSRSSRGPGPAAGKRRNRAGDRGCRCPSRGSLPGTVAASRGWKVGCSRVPPRRVLGLETAPPRWFTRLWAGLGTRPRNSSVFPLLLASQANETFRSPQAGVI